MSYPWQIYTDCFWTPPSSCTTKCVPGGFRSMVAHQRVWCWPVCSFFEAHCNISLRYFVKTIGWWGFCLKASWLNLRYFNSHTPQNFTISAQILIFQLPLSGIALLGICKAELPQNKYHYLCTSTKWSGHLSAFSLISWISYVRPWKQRQEVWAWCLNGCFDVI